MRGRNEQSFDKVLVLGLMRRNAHAASPLRLVFGNGLTLDVARMRHGDDDVLALDQIFDIDLAVVVGKFGAALGRILFHDRAKVGLDDLQNARFVGEDIP